MSASASPVARIILRMLVEGRLPGVIARYAHRRALTDEAWSRAYHELRTAERALESADDGARPALSSSQHAFLRARVLASVQAQRRPAVAHKSVPWLAGAAAAASLAFFIYASPNGNEGAVDDGWRARSAHSTSTSTSTSDGDVDVGGIRVHCVDKARTQVLDEADLSRSSSSSSSSSSPATLKCPAGGLLAFSATNRGDTQRFPALIAQEGNVVAFTVPFEGEDSAPVPPKTVAMRLARGAPLDEQPAQRELVLRGALFREPLPAAKIASALDDIKDAPSLRVMVTAP